MLKFYLQLVKTPQTGLLIFTAFAGYQSAVNAGSMALSQADLILAFVGLLLVVCGTTSLNMVFDHDIDSLMERTKNRPIPKGVISTMQASILSWLSIIIGTAINYKISLIYSFVVLLGFLFDFIVYTIWLKRRSAWSIVFGGLSGGMPVLAGRVLATGSVDMIGILLAIAILLWIPTHILTLAMNHDKDYKLAGVPTFPNKLGFKATRYIIAITNLLTAIILVFVGYNLNINEMGIQILRIGSLVLFILSFRLVIDPSRERNFTLFKYASLFMAGVMLIFIL
ncbi:MAG: protoheme IX farnesyltransferase [Candidatus Marinimicrobia bacterium]|nr:protoheme IX farnesyltransferase [Candidatus Neomarinimicrobiota bacterium]MBL7022692.1 protoheme IX farnesyltransferase [Candidatus Neomarinimicrobiota bacterium]MBL7109179.1 protoheme IX farnesyltransferase [Candidatus Neomarinimicrobiota bacterium]